MKKIVLSGVFGIDIIPHLVSEEMSEANGGDIEFDFSSPGGLVFEGVETYNLIRDYKRENPSAQIILNIKSIAASMGSYFASNPSFDLVTVEDNAVYMIHNPLMGVVGDYIEMQKAVKHLDSLAGLYAVSYSDKSKISMDKIRQIMNAETWYYGDEIVKAGFADEVMKTETSMVTKDSIFAMARMSFDDAKLKIKQHEMKDSDFEKVAAMLKDKIEPTLIVDQDNFNGTPENTSEQPAPGGENNQEDVLMNLEELKTKHPEIHAEAMKAGADQEKAAEKERVKSLMEMKEKKDFEGIEVIQSRIDEAIMAGESVGDVNAAIVALSFNNGVAAAMETNAIGEVNPGKENDTVSGEKGKPKSEAGEF